jgi:Zn-dependent oligopeptidase
LGYDNLSEEDKLEEAIRFVATGQPMPERLIEFLREANLYDAIMAPIEEPCLHSSGA